ncbi:MFS transporter [Pseudomonas sp. GV071]|uniref:MFS transporter n=1 Tax=Pseudomonas sp. GV071 TaxID=2135754 RepID=UPI000D353610|nr:MFS transporter [Pseudomonas sp. GV071]PTQ70523.1 putative MFS family arabinose efflux permease [Pseudomonas sp. GV071]
MNSACPALSPAAPPVQATTPRALVLLFAVASGLSVANVYYAQPLLDALARDFAISSSAVGGVITATQLGCGLSLLFLVPLGDRLDRRRLLLAQLLALVVALATVALASNTGLLLLGMLAIGLLGTAMTQGLIALAASTASVAEQGRVVGTAQSGVFIGLLLARAYAGTVSDLGGWRSVYALAALLMLALAWLLWRRLPNSKGQTTNISYRQLLVSMLGLLRHDRMLHTRGMLALFMFAALNIFWSALVLPLSAPPYGFSHSQIGAFGLVGVVGALAAFRAGAWADRGFAQRTSGVALLVLLLAWAPLALMGQSLWALVLGIILLDLGGQALHVTNQSLILRNHADAPGRLIGLYMLFYAVGSGIGALASTLTFAHFGWYGVCLLGAAVCLLALIFWASTRAR